MGCTLLQPEHSREGNRREGGSLPEAWGVGPAAELPWAELTQGLQQAWIPFLQITGTTEQASDTGFCKVHSDTWKAGGAFSTWGWGHQIGIVPRPLEGPWTLQLQLLERLMRTPTQPQKPHGWPWLRLHLQIQQNWSYLLQSLQYTPLPNSVRYLGLPLYSLNQPSFTH